MDDAVKELVAEVNALSVRDLFRLAAELCDQGADRQAEAVGKAAVDRLTFQRLMAGRPGEKP